MEKNRSSRPSHAPASQPTTWVGLWLRAGLLGEQKLRGQLKLRLNEGKRTGWNNDEPAVLEAACELAVRRFFGSDYSTVAVAEFVSELQMAAGAALIGQPEAEMLIRSAYGDQDVRLKDITPGKRFQLRSAIVALAVGKLKLGEAAIDQLIFESERVAFARGWKPPLAR